MSELSLRSVIATFLIALLAIAVVLALGSYTYLNYFAVQPVTKVIISQQLRTELNEGFANTPDHEFALCLKGKIEGSVANITEWEDAEIIEMSEDGNEIKASCPFNIIGTIHNHNNGVCAMSPQDVYTFGKSRTSIIGVICGEDTIAFYSCDSLERSVDVVFE